MMLSDAPITQIRNRFGLELVSTVNPTSEALMEHFGGYILNLDKEGFLLFGAVECPTESGPVDVHPVKAAVGKDESRDGLAARDPAVGTAAPTTVSDDQLNLRTWSWSIFELVRVGVSRRFSKKESGYAS